MYTRMVPAAVLLLGMWAGAARVALAQVPPVSADRAQVSANVSVTNKGISFVPTFTLGKPATIVDLIVRKRNLSFEPQFRYGLNGKPWSFLFWGRYRLVATDKFRLVVGGHPSVSFKATTIASDSGPRELLSATRYLAGEVAPTYVLSPRLSVGAYYLYSRGLDPGLVKHNQYFAARTTLTNLPLSDAFTLQLVPQLYYLRLDGNDGVYFSNTVTVTRRNSPISVSSLVSAPLGTSIAGGRDTLWNISLNYALR